MGEMLAMPTPDPIAETCQDAYEGEGMFFEGGWATIPRSVAIALVPGEDFGQFIESVRPSPDDPDVVVGRERLDHIERVTAYRERVGVLVAPAVSTVAQRAQAEHWTVGELTKAVKGIAAEYGPRVKRLAERASELVDE